MELNELIDALKVHFKSNYDVDIEVCDGFTRQTVNRQGRLFDMMENEDNPELDMLYEVDDYFQEFDAFLTDRERELQQEVNRHICIILTNQES